MPLFLSANKIEIKANQTNRKHMEWLKIFGSEEEARTQDERKYSSAGHCEK